VQVDDPRPALGGTTDDFEACD